MLKIQRAVPAVVVTINHGNLGQGRDPALGSDGKAWPADDRRRGGLRGFLPRNLYQEETDAGRFGLIYELQLPRPLGRGRRTPADPAGADRGEIADRLGYDYVWANEQRLRREQHSYNPALPRYFSPPPPPATATAGLATAWCCRRRDTIRPRTWSN